jgi:membrane protease YdiL (CAAX protease family)
MLSVAAGVGEELAFRAYAILALAVVLGSPWWALVVATTSFGLVHVYQGGVGLVRTYLLGLALGASYLVAGSLWPAIIAHTLVDVVGGLVLGERLVGPPASQPTPAG